MQRRVARQDKYYNTPQHPTEAPRKTSTDRRYSLEEVRDWCERMLESKLKYLHREIAQNNEIIRQLNERLKQGEREMEKKQKLLQQHVAGQARQSYSRSDMIEISNKLLNDKLREKFEQANKLLQELDANKHQLKRASHSEVEVYQQKMEERINRNIFELKASLRQRCEDIKKNNSLYWNKIKGWAKMFEEKLGKCDSNVGLLLKQSDKIEELVNNSVMGLYKLKSFQTRFRQVELAIYDLQESFKVISETQLELKDLVEGNNRVELSYSKDEFTYRNDDIQYRIDDEYQIGSGGLLSNLNTPTNTNQNLFSANHSQPRDQQASYQASYQHSRPSNIMHIPIQQQQFGFAPMSATTGTFRKDNTQYRVDNTTCLKPPTPPPSVSPPQQKSKSSPQPNDYSLLSSVKSQFGQFLQHAPQQTEVSRASSFKSLAASQTSESRKQMMVDLRQRLETVFTEKKLQTPVPCFLDEINYLKNSYNNYLFDTRGNMFKMKREEFQQLCSEGLLRKIG